jgi:hypothetical protein
MIMTIIVVVGCWLFVIIIINIIVFSSLKNSGKQNVTASDVIISAKSVSDAAGKLSGSVTSSQEEFIKALKFIVETNRELVNNVKGTPSLCNQPNVVQQVVLATKGVLEASLKELEVRHNTHSLSLSHTHTHSPLLLLLLIVLIFKRIKAFIACDCLNVSFLLFV